MQNDTPMLHQSWLAYDQESHFPLENIPFGCFKTCDGCIVNCTRVGDHIVDLSAIFQLFKGPLFSTLTKNVFENCSLNSFAALGKEFRVEARQTIQKLFTDKSFEHAVRPHLFDANTVEMKMPM
jgi:fumarylacetoacetase